ncbi:MAG: hypothetical protein AAF721_10825 [Myxococcota bacterium]
MWSGVIAWIGAGLCIGACTDRTGGAEEGSAPVTVAPASAVPPAKPCRPHPAGRMLSAFDAGTCGAALVADDQGLGLWSLAPDGEEPPARGPGPQACEKSSCTFLGYDSPLGPIVLAKLAAPSSEMPAGVWLGVALDPAGLQLVFFDLWAGAGDTVTGDSTDLGPAHSLAPFTCGGKLGLFAVGRLAAGVDVAPSKRLASREGIYTWGTDAPQRAAATREGCEPFAIELP